MWKLAKFRLGHSLSKSAADFDLKKAVLYIVGTLLLGLIAQASEIRYSGSDPSILSMIKSSQLETKLAISCKLISEEKGLLHEFDTLGDFDVAAQGSFSQRSNLENLGTLKARLSLNESQDVFGSLGTARTVYVIQIQFPKNNPYGKEVFSGVMKVSSEEEASLIIDLNAKEFIKCVNTKITASQSPESLSDSGNKMSKE